MSAQRLAPALLDALPAAVARPGYDRGALRLGMAHLGVGAFHRCHQAEYTDDMLGQRMDRWGVVGINLRPPELAPTLGRQNGLYTRLTRSNAGVEARVIGCILAVVDAQNGPAPALTALAAAEIDVVTLTVTEKAYGHAPATGILDAAAPEVAHDIARPEAPRSLPGLILQALERRRRSHGRPLTLISCDNIPGNGAILGGVVRDLAAQRGGGLAAWIEAHAAFPSTMVDRIAPATTAEDIAEIERAYGYRDEAAAVGEPFRQWVIEDRFAGRRPPWDLAGAAFVADVAPYELTKMRVLNAAQSTLAYLGVLTGWALTSEAVADPLLEGFVRRMLVEESLGALPPAPGMEPMAYVEASLARLRNAAIRHRCHQIATDGSQKILQRLVNPAAERLARGEAAPLLTVAIAAWMAYLILASARFGRAWPAEDPQAGRVAAIADQAGRDPPALVAGILGIGSVFAPALAARPEFRAGLAEALADLLSGDPKAALRRRLGAGAQI